MRTRTPVRLLVALAMALLAVWALGGCARPAVNAPPAGSSKQAIRTGDAVIDRAVVFAGGRSGKIVGYRVDFRLTTARKGQQANQGVLELVVMDDGRVYEPGGLSPVGAWQPTPTPRTGVESLADRKAQGATLGAAARRVTRALARTHSTVHVNDVQVYSYIVRVTGENTMTNVEVDPSATRAVTLGLPKEWPWK